MMVRGEGFEPPTPHPHVMRYQAALRPDRTIAAPDKADGNRRRAISRGTGEGKRGAARRSACALDSPPRTVSFEMKLVLGAM